MHLSSILDDPDSIFVVDTSAVISMTVCGRATQIVSAVPNRIIVSNVVISELETGRGKGYTNAEQLHQLIESDLMEAITMGSVAEKHFEELIVGSARNTLDDGEAATIASALEIGGVPLIDERKARRICEEKYPNLSYGCSVDIFAHREVGKMLGKADLMQAVLSALKQSNMRVPPEYQDWVVNLIGHKNASECKSLPNSVRQRANVAPKLMSES